MGYIRQKLWDILGQKLYYILWDILAKTMGYVMQKRWDIFRKIMG